MGNDHNCFTYLIKKNLELTEMNDKLLEEKMTIEKERNELLMLKPSEQVLHWNFWILNSLKFSKHSWTKA